MFLHIEICNLFVTRIFNVNNWKLVKNYVCDIFTKENQLQIDQRKLKQQKYSQMKCCTISEIYLAY